MTTASQTFRDTTGPATGRPQLLRRLVAGAAPFDAAMGVLCLAVPGRIAGWLSVSAGDVRITGAVFLVAAAAGAVALRTQPVDARAVVAGNAAFAVWCLALLAAGHPNALGAVLLAGAAATSAATAVAEHRLSRAA